MFPLKNSGWKTIAFQMSVDSGFLSEDSSTPQLLGTPKYHPQNVQIQGWQLNDFLFSPLFGEDSHFDSYFSKGLKPPTRNRFPKSDGWFWQINASPFASNMVIFSIWASNHKHVS